MNFEDFHKSLAQNNPPKNIIDELTALWHDAKGDWNKAHKIVQDIPSDKAAWVHAYLHRKEGDEGNAAYWYRRAGKTFCNSSLEQEWKDIAEELLK